MISQTVLSPLISQNQVLITELWLSLSLALGPFTLTHSHPEPAYSPSLMAPSEDRLTSV